MEDPREEIEIVLLNKPEVLVYKIPPRPTTGHRAEFWKECFWKGKLQVVRRSDCCILKFIDVQTGDLFAKCPLPENYEQACERTVDSSRYFAVRLDDGKGRHAFVGMGFEDRADAFDVVCTLADFSRQLKTDQNCEKTVYKSDKSKIHPFQEGEKITVKFKGLKSKSKTKASRQEQSNEAIVGGLLPPPPSSPSKSNHARIISKDRTFESS